MALAVGLTGGIGSGKSTVADQLVARGAVLVDADRIAREVVAPDGPAYQPLVDRFGAAIVAPDGAIDRRALAALAFPDPQALVDLNAITHPAIAARMAERRRQADETAPVVVVDVPLMRAEHRELLGLDLVVVVDCPVEVAVERLVAQRGFERADAEARVAAQASREDRRRGADVVIDNAGDRAALRAQTAALWARFEAMADGRPDPGGPEPGGA